jgi:prepilin-type N-terminal cleavage/methylation domain-containing protein
MTHKLQPLANAPQKPGCGTRGFTLVEMMVALAIASIVMAVIFGVYASLMRSYTTQNVAAEVQQAVRAGVDYMAEDIMMAGFDPIGTTAFEHFEEAGDTRISIAMDLTMDGEISDTDSERVTYNYIDGEKRIYQSGTPYIDNVTDLTFTYIDADGDTLFSPLDEDARGDIRSVVISITVEEDSGRDETVERTYATQVWCRNPGL